jgi:archaellum biogenesis ATPase FlaH
MSTWNQKTTLAEFNKAELDEKKQKANEFFIIPSGLKFIDDHFGLRPGCIHTLMGSTGSGKSTVTQSMILEWGRRIDMLVYLTEESKESFELKLYEKESSPEYLSPNLHLMHEKELVRAYGDNDFRSFLRDLEAAVAESKAKILIIDNLTTSAFYDNKLQATGPILSGLRSIADHYKIAIFIIVHTKKGVSETSKGLMEPDDVRGSATIANTSDYFYIFYRVGATTGSGAKIYSNFIYVNKSRFHDTQGNFYRLRYDYRTKRYISDERIGFNEFKNLMKERDRL